MKEDLVAPCGMNCAICSGFLAHRHDVRSHGIRIPYCAGCRPRDKKCAFLKKTCHLLLSGAVRFCYQCSDFPCKRLEQLDKRYRTLYRMSMIENLQVVSEKGVDSLLASERQKWQCPECGGTICCHNGICFDCGLEALRERRTLYRWETIQGRGTDE